MAGTAPPHFHVAGVLVQALAAATEEVAGEILGWPGSRVHASEAGKLVVTLESEDPSFIVDRITRLQHMEGVVSAVLVSEHSTPLAAANEVIPHELPPQDPP